MEPETTKGSSVRDREGDKHAYKDSRPETPLPATHARDSVVRVRYDNFPARCRVTVLGEPQSLGLTIGVGLVLNVEIILGPVVYREPSLIVSFPRQS